MRAVRTPSKITIRDKRNDRSRYIFLGIVVAVASVGLYLYQIRYFSLDTSAPDANTSQERADTTAGADANNDASAQLQGAVDTWLQAHGSGYRVVVQSLNDATAAVYKADEPIVPASTYKLFVAYAAYHEVEAGRLSLATSLSNGKTVEQCLEKAIVQSDNACAEAVGFKIGWNNVDQLIAAAGFSQTTLNNYAAGGGYTGDKQSSAADISNLLVQLHDGKLMNAGHTTSLLDYMKRQVYRSGIPAGSGGSVVADKVGFLPSYTHDAAIVYGPDRTYVLVIMSETGDNWVNIKSLAQVVYDTFGRKP